MNEQGDNLKKFINETGKAAFGMTRDEAHAQRICIFCKKSVPAPEQQTEEEKWEYETSALCPVCFDGIMTSVLTKFDMSEGEA